MKYGNKHYFEHPLYIYESPYNERISSNAKQLYTLLKVLENKYCSDSDTSFYQTDEQLCCMLKWSKKTLRKYKDELRKYPKLLEIEARRIDKGKQVTFYTIH